METTYDKDNPPVLTEEEKKRQKEAIAGIHGKKKYKKITWSSILKWFGLWAM